MHYGPYKWFCIFRWATNTILKCTSHTSTPFIHHQCTKVNTQHTFLFSTALNTNHASGGMSTIRISNGQKTALHTYYGYCCCLHSLHRLEPHTPVQSATVSTVHRQKVEQVYVTTHTMAKGRQTTQVTTVSIILSRVDSLRSKHVNSHPDKHGIQTERDMAATLSPLSFRAMSVYAGVFLPTGTPVTQIQTFLSARHSRHGHHLRANGL